MTNDINLALLLMRSMPRIPGLPSLATPILNRPIRGLNRTPINYGHDEDNQNTMQMHQGIYTFKELSLIPVGSTVAV